MTVLAPQPASPPFDRYWRLSVAQYHRMIACGILTDDDPVELLEGILVTKMSKNPPHVTAADLTADQFEAVKPAGWFVKRQDPITTTDSEPESDVSLIRGNRRDFANRHPGPEDIAIVVEVADSTLDRDRLKKRVYARARIPIYWIVNLVDRKVEVYMNPSGPDPAPDYGSTIQRGENDSVDVVVGTKIVASIAVRDLLP